MVSMLLGSTGLDPIDTAINFTAFGVLCILILHVFRHTIPRLAGRFEEAIAVITAAYREDAREQRQVFTEELRLQRQDFKDFLLVQHQEIGKLTNSVNDLIHRVEERMSA